VVPIVVVVLGAVVVVVDGAVVVVVEGAVVVVVVPGPFSPPTICATQLSTSASTDAVSSSVSQSLPLLFSSFSKQPFVASAPPSNLAFTLSTHPLVFGSAGLPGVCASCWHLRRPATLPAMHFFLDTPHLLCVGVPGSTAPISCVTQASTCAST